MDLEVGDADQRVATVAVGASFPFPRNGETSAASSITRLGASTFQLAAAGVYSVAFYASIDEAAQLVLSVNGAELAATAVGRVGDGPSGAAPARRGAITAT